MSKKGGHETPDDLDYLFERDFIDQDDYPEFWEGYWQRWDGGDKYEVNPDQREYIDQWLNVFKESRELLEQEGQGNLNIPQVAGVVTRNRHEAKLQASRIGGKVVRRDAKGKFSKRGHYYQAVAKGKRKSKTV